MREIPLRPSSGAVLAATISEITREAVGDEGFLAIEDVVIAVSMRARLDRFKIAARTRFGEGERGDGLAARHFG